MFNPNFVIFKSDVQFIENSNKKKKQNIRSSQVDLEGGTVYRKTDLVS